MESAVTVNLDGNGVLIVEGQSLPGRFSRGDTKDEAITLRIDVRAGQGLPLTFDTRQLEVGM